MERQTLQKNRPNLPKPNLATTLASLSILFISRNIPAIATEVQATSENPAQTEVSSSEKVLVASIDRTIVNIANDAWNFGVSQKLIHTNPPMTPAQIINLRNMIKSYALELKSRVQVFCADERNKYDLSDIASKNIIFKRWMENTSELKLYNKIPGSIRRHIAQSIFRDFSPKYCKKGGGSTIIPNPNKPINGGGWTFPPIPKLELPPIPFLGDPRAELLNVKPSWQSDSRNAQKKDQKPLLPWQDTSLPLFKINNTYQQ